MKKRRIGIDARLLYQTGVGVYLRNLLFHLAKVKDQNTEIAVFAKKNDWSRFLDEYSLGTQHFEFRICDVSWHSFSEQISFAWQLYRAKLDIVHFPYFSWPILYFKPFVATIHDTILLKHATGRATTLPVVWYYIKSLIFRFVFWQQVLRAKAIFVPSNAVANELEGYYPSAKSKIVVTHEGVDEIFANSISQKPDSFPYEGKSYFLYVGNAYPHKNVEILLKSISQSKEQSLENERMRLVLVGPKSIFVDKLKKEYSHLEHDVLWLHNVKVNELKWLYASAKALVLPSKAEGFGLPIVEAMGVGCPLILSDIPVFHEIAGKRAIYFAAEDSNELANKLVNEEFVSPIETNEMAFFELAKKTLEYYD